MQPHLIDVLYVDRAVDVASHFRTGRMASVSHHGRGIVRAKAWHRGSKWRGMI